ncbi:hypothetical protein L1887_26752 [Cichorium endivia]|nr:hypothetical protein L1887_26752 [Cichorium endivia]
MERKRRSSQRLRENSKPKFKNTAATAVDLDDDDDFVSPPRETKLGDERVLQITSGPTVKKGKEKSEYGPGLRRLSTRMKPGRICEAAAGLSPEQREALIYVYSMKYETIPLNKRPPFVVRVTTKILTAVENFEINSGGFGKRQSDLRDEEYPSEHDVDIDEMVKDFADEEAFCAIVDIGFNKILKEKENMEIALSAGLAKFPESELLISWKNKIKHMFYGETDSEDIDSHDKGNESWNDEPYESPKKNEETDKIEDDIQPDDVYKTPLQVVNETRVDTSSMTASQFFDLPGVAEEVIQLVDKTTAEKDLKEKGKDVETKELKHYVRRKRKLPRNLKSPFVSRVVSLSSNVISIEKDFCDSIFVSTRDYE